MKNKLTDIVLFIVCILMILGAAMMDSKAAESAECSEWSNFSKVVTYRLRDTGRTATDIKAELSIKMAGNAELPIALAWIDYVYAHPDIDATTMWDAVYHKCRANMIKTENAN